LINAIAAEFNLPEKKIDTVVKLLKEGNTIPFIARYRKEMTGGLDDKTLRDIEQRVSYLEKLTQRKEEIAKNIEEQGKLTAQLTKEIQAATTLARLEDLYRPYKQKKSTRAAKAREKGLEPLAQHIYQQDQPLNQEILAQYINPEMDLNNGEDCLAGSLDIIAEWISDNAELRSILRQLSHKETLLTASAKEEVHDTPYRDYADYKETVMSIPAHRILAINRGERDGFLSVNVDFPREKISSFYARKIIKPHSPTTAVIEDAITDALKRLILPSMEREIRSELKDKAEAQAIKIFGENLDKLLLQSPVMDKKIVAIDPGFRTGCKVAAINESGDVLATDTIYPTAPHNKTAQAEEVLLKLINKHSINLLAIGNGTASRETELFVSELIKKHHLPVNYTIVSEAGASVYSASKIAQEEFPQLDVSLRSAVSIARRLQDPLAELVKIEPKAIGVGQYQHDVNQKALNEKLGGVVEDCVNSVGVNLNTASSQLLSYVAGLTPSLTKKIAAWREKEGSFTTRKQLKKVSGLGPKAFEQCAGFLRIPDSANPLDNTAVHPESYAVVESLTKQLGKPLEKILGDSSLKQLSPKQWAAELNVGLPTLQDIFEELMKPGRDPREDNFPPLFRQDVMELEEINPGMSLQGVVRNVVDFGAFVDIGVHQDGLIHISQLSHNYVKHPLDVLAVGDIVTVTVLDVDVSRKRIGLSLIKNSN